MPTAVIGFVYPAVQAYFEDYAQSIQNQSDQDFSFFLFCDGWQPDSSLKQKLPPSTHFIDLTGSVAAIRKSGIRLVLERGFDEIIFTDTDDLHDLDRVRVSKVLLKSFDIVVNELFLFGTHIEQSHSVIGSYLKNRALVSSEFLRNKNCIGMSNSSVRAKDLEEILKLLPDDLVAFDWPFFGMLLEAGKTAVYTDETRTLYRQYDENIASLSNLSEDLILRGLAIKLRQHELLSDHSAWHRMQTFSFKETLERLAVDSHLKKVYCAAVRENKKHATLWWEPIQSLEELSL